MEFALKAENVSIRYITGDFKDIGIKEYVSRKATHNYHVNEFMAVDGVSFTLERGDMLGIVGTNGAGKSTLLKAVSGIMEPTKGKITANGEVAALLELGSGFDGDLTVKENAYLRGAMLGYTKEFMDETYDHIIDFAELREFENRPFKQLSSGMKSRLAFSIASLVKPDILILDEVLSVGDGAFQEKSAKKMREIISRGATTILVSHSLAQIRELCNKVLWLDHGKQIMFGDTKEVCDLYEKYLNGEISVEDCLSRQEIYTDSIEQCVTEEINKTVPRSEIIRSKSGEENLQNRAQKEIVHSKSINGMRGIASVIIALFHFGQVYPMGDFFSCGYLPVEMFFALSGFLLVASIEGKFNLNPLKEGWKRIKRLYPVYFTGTISLALLYSLVWYKGDVLSWISSNPSNKVAMFTELLAIQTTGIGDFTYINYPAWYVSTLILVTFALIILYRVCNKRIFQIIIAINVMIIYPVLIFTDSYATSAGYISHYSISAPILRGVAGMSLGVSLYYLYKRFKCFKWSYTLLRLIGRSSFVCIIAITVLGKTSRLDYLILIPVCLFIFSCFNMKEKPCIALLENRFVQYLGRISYSFYIMQSFSQNVVQIYVIDAISNPYVLNAVYLLINFFVGSICYYVIERKSANYFVENREKTFVIVRVAVVAAFFVFVLFKIGTNINFANDQVQDTVLIYSETAGANVTYRGAEVDGVWVSPWDNVPDHGNWLFDEENATYTATDNTPLTVEIPQGKERTITFNVGPDEGSVRVEMSGEELHFDLNQGVSVELGLPFSLPAGSVTDKTDYDKEQ